MHQISKKVLIVLIIIFLFLPFLQKSFDLWSIKPLNGSFEVRSYPKEQNLKNFLDRDFQAKYAEYITDNLGFRPALVRLYNQLNYSLFRKTNTKVVIGKEDHLYYQNYIDTYLAKDNLPKEEIQTRVAQAKKIQDAMEKQNKYFIFVIVPDKVSFAPQYLPKEYSREYYPDSNYDFFVEEFEKQGINYLDLREYFKDTKNIPYQIFPKGGTHWTEPAMLESITKVIGNIEDEYNKELTHVIWQGQDANPSSERIKRDKDAEELLNLMYDNSTEEQYYPNITFEEGQFKPKVIVVADSFFGSVFRSYIPQNVFQDSQYWYYGNLNLKIEQGREDQKEEIKNIDVDSRLKDTDIVIMSANSANLKHFGYDLLDDMCRVYKCENSE